MEVMVSLLVAIGTSKAGAGSTGTNFGVGSVISGVEVTTKAEGAGLDVLLSSNSISLTSNGVWSFNVKLGGVLYYIPI